MIKYRITINSTCNYISIMESTTKIKQIIKNSQNGVQSAIKSLEINAKKEQKQDCLEKLRVVLGYVLDHDADHLIQYLAQFEDSDVTDLANSIKESESKVTIQEEILLVKDVKDVKDVKNTKEDSKNKQNKDTKKNLNRSNSLIKGVIGMFIKQDPNVHQMILPQKQPKCYYDPIKKRHIIEGEQQEEVAPIPKPPPAKKTAQPNLKKKTKTSQFEQMMAPPTFKRKGGKSNKQSKTSEVINFSNIEAKINEIFDKTIQGIEEELSNELDANEINTVERIPIFNETSPIPKNTSSFPVHLLRELEDVTEQIENVQSLQEKLVNKLLKLDANSHKQSKFAALMNRFTEIESQNMNILKTATEVVIKQYSRKSSQSLQLQQSQLMRNQEYETLRIENEKLHKNIEQISRTFASSNDQIREKNREIMILLENERKLKDEVLNEKREAEGREGVWNDKYQKMQSLLQSAIRKNREFQAQFQELERQLKAHETRELSRTDLMNSINESLLAENELLQSIQSKRISISTQDKQLPQRSEEACSKAPFLNLSDTLTKVIQHYENQICTIKRETKNLQQKYQNLKLQLIKVSQGASAQNQALQRNLNRMKSLVETYKQSKQQNELKLEESYNQSSILKRQITHLKKQYTYTKQLLEQNMRSSHDNTATLKEQLESQISILQQQVSQKQQSQQILHKQLSFLTSQIDAVILQKNSLQARINQMQKQIKQYEDTISSLELSEGELENKIEFANRAYGQLEQRYKELKVNTERTVKNMKEKMKQLSEQNKVMNRMKTQSEQMKKSNEQMINQINDLRVNNRRYVEVIKQKNMEIQKYRSYQQQKGQLEGVIGELEKQIKALRKQLQEYKLLYHEQTSDFEILIQEFTLTKQYINKQQREVKQKISDLVTMLQQSQQGSSILQRQVMEYEGIVKKMDGKFQEIKSEVEELREREREREKEREREREKEREREREKEREKEKEKEREEEREREKEREKEKEREEEVKKREEELRERQQKLKKKQNQVKRKEQELRRQNEAKMREQEEREEEESLKNENSVLKMEKQKLKELNKLLQDSKDILEKERNEFENITVEMEKEIEELQVKLEEMKKLLQKQKQRHAQEYASILEQKNKELEQRVEAYKVLSIELNNKNEEFDIIYLEMEEKEKMIAEERRRFERDIKELKESCDEIKKQYEEVPQSVNNEISDNMSQRSYQSNTNTTKKNSLINNIQTLKQQSKKKELEMKILQKQIAQRDELIETMNAEISRMEMEKSKQEREREKQAGGLKKQIQGLRREISMKEEELLLVRGVLKQDQEKKQPLNNDLIQLQQLIIAQNQQLEEQKQAVLSLNRKLQGYQISVQKLEKQKSQLEDLYHKKTEQAELSIDKLEHRIRQLIVVQNQYKKLQSSYSELEHENSDLIKEKKQILKSKDEIMVKFMGKGGNHGRIQSQSLPIESNREASGKNNSGFFSSISSLFLTPTETQKLEKRKQNEIIRM